MTVPKAKRRALTYADAGVDLDARRRFVESIREIARSTHGPEVLSGVGPFAGLFQLGDYRAPVLVSSTDSVGTKVKIASLLGRFDTIGVDLVHQNVNDILALGAEPLFFLDYIASATLDAEEKMALVRGVASACRDVGCALIGGETADMPGVYAPGDLDLVGFVVGVVERDAIIDGSTIGAGDALLGLPSSGLHTNGFALVRQVFSVGVGGDAAEERARLERSYPELTSQADLSQAEGATPSRSSSAKGRSASGGGQALGETLLTPHRGYYNALKLALADVKGIAHITGGGLIDNVPRMLPDGLGARLDRAAWPAPPIFDLIQREGGIDEAEMFRTFNMGLGLVLAVDPSDVDAVRSAVPDALVVGEVVRQEGAERVAID